MNTHEEREAMLASMREIAAEFYASAMTSKCHPFIEFAGLMNEYVQLCEQAHREGVDFTQTDVHNGKALPMRAFQAAYIGEKVGCIYGPSLKEEGNLNAFIEQVTR